ncbi:helix-turn-helix domain-containing protein [Methylobacterium sp. J-090]|uniref:helix-turn-helix domain-containing protein n=1 Tax=Methylobacterium sp. J-090 TaxID=2836666 RepID=UPI001FBA08BE|nr:helix-turn-helix transcriptional regulator [Methylobacterium sp. J-090]MCJ2081043.1 helix-turn-helix domain-containing protein [Methylobacterium sp. J-090]
MKKIEQDVMAEPSRDNATREIGPRIKSLRRSAGLSQANLGSALGVTFQQVQKYESGRSRIAADKLHQIAQTMGVDISYFYDTKPEGSAPEKGTPPAVGRAEDSIFKEAFDRIKDPRARYLLSELARVICEIEAGK